MESESASGKLDAALGDVGRWQIGIVLLMCLTKFPVIWSLLGLVFLAPPVAYHCDGSNSTCLDSGGRSCSSWTYDTSLFSRTIVTEWDLVCERRQLVNLGQVIFITGVMIGNVVFSVISDKIGRKWPIVGTGAVMAVMGCISAVMPWYSGFVLFRFLQALAVGGSICTTHVMCIEVLGPRSRPTFGTLTHLAIFLGTGCTAVVAYFTRDWRHFQVAVSLPAIVTLAYWWLIPESPRWLLAVGRTKEALVVARAAAKKNNNPPPEFLDKVPLQRKAATERKEGLQDLVRSRGLLLRSLNIWFSFGAVSLCFYGIEQYLTEIGDNMFINVAVSGVVMAPGVIISMFTMQRLGRKPTQYVSQLITAVCCFSVAFLSHDHEKLKTALAILGVTGTAVTFSTVFLYGAELFPTVIRNSGVGVGAMCSRIGAMIAPFVVSMDVFSAKAPPLFFACSSLIAFVLTLFLPETLGRQLPQTIQEAEDFGRKETRIHLDSVGSRQESSWE